MAPIAVASADRDGCAKNNVCMTSRLEPSRAPMQGENREQRVHNHSRKCTPDPQMVPRCECICTPQLMSPGIRIMPSCQCCLKFGVGDWEGELAPPGSAARPRAWTRTPRSPRRRRREQVAQDFGASRRRVGKVVVAELRARVAPLAIVPRPPIASNVFQKATPWLLAAACWPMMIRSMTALVRSSPSLPLMARSSGDATRIGTPGAPPSPLDQRAEDGLVGVG